MHKVHAGYTVLARLKLDTATKVSELLVAMNADPARLPFARAMTTHFATGAVLPAQSWGDEELPATLMIATSFSGPARAHEKDLVATVGPGLRELFASCEGFTEDCSDAELVRFMRRHRRAETFYSGMHHLDRADVLRNAALRERIAEFVDARQDTGHFAGTALSIRREIQDFVAGQPDLAWTRDPFGPGDGALLALHWRTFLVLGGVLAYFAALLVVTLGAAWSHPLKIAAGCGWLVVIVALFTLFALIAGVRFAEIGQAEVASRPPDDHVRALAATQCRAVINEMTIAGPIKDGSTRPIVMRLALWIVARLAEGIPRVREGINIPTVATARWIATDRGRRLVFISNFTNDAEPYVRDFIDSRLGAMRINLTFGFGGRYPKTDWLILRGAVEDPNAFIHVVHANQRATELWFSPYANLSIDNIKSDHKLRVGLVGDMTESAAREWLQRI